MLTFLSPLFLIGLLSAAIPLLIHLSRSRRTKKMRFSTTRFFTDQFLRSYRMSRLKELLLLACRMALCALLAMALARPLFLPRGQSFLRVGSRCIVLVIDNSASMGYAENRVSLFEQARAAARDVLETLKPGDTASVVLAGRRAAGPEVLFAEPTAELGDVLHAVNVLSVASLGTDLTGATMRAEAIAQASTATSKEVYVLSDLQDSGWELPEQETAAADTSDVLFFFVQVRPEKPANLGITAVQYAAARPMVGVPFAIRPHLSIQGDAARSCEVRLFIDGQRVGERQVDRLPDGRWPAPRFHYTFQSGGWHTGYLEVQDEKWALDNRRYFAFEVLDQVRVLAVNGAPSQVPRLDELFFLRTALTAGPEDKGPIQVDAVSPAAVAESDLSKYPLVILPNVESLPAVAVEKLETFVDRGGSLLIFLGDKVSTSFYNENLASPSRLHGGLLPGRLLQVQGNPAASEDFATGGEVDYDHIALSAFQDAKFANLASVRYQALWNVDAGSSAVLMRASTGAPLLCEKAFGKGRVLLFTSTCDRDWTDFPVRPAFLPWVHRLVAYLAQEPMGTKRFHVTGDSIPLPVAASEGMPQIVVKKADGTLGHATYTGDTDHPLVFNDTTQPGVYSVIASDKKAASSCFAVNLDGYESDLRYLDDILAEQDESDASREAKIEAGLKKLLPGRPLVTYVNDPGNVGEVALGASRGLKLWDYVLFVVLLIAVVEPWLANRISLRHYTRAAARTGVRPAAFPPASAAVQEVVTP
jgi:hypothetical protein